MSNDLVTRGEIKEATSACYDTQFKPGTTESCISGVLACAQFDTGDAPKPRAR